MTTYYQTVPAAACIASVDGNVYVMSNVRDCKDKSGHLALFETDEYRQRRVDHIKAGVAWLKLGESERRIADLPRGVIAQ